MGMMIEGRWHEHDEVIQDGAFVRQASAMDQPVSDDVVARMACEPARYHLIASLSCPWSHRTLITRRLKGLAMLIPLQVAGGPRIEGYGANGGRDWRVPGSGAPIRHVHELYAMSDPAFTGRASVPILWDAHTQRIISNESAQIIRAFDAVPAGDGMIDFTLRPNGLTAKLETLNHKITVALSNAVYQAGLAQAQPAYDEAVASVFSSLHDLEERLSNRRYLFGTIITETDWVLFATLCRFDVVYFTHFRCTRRRLIDYPNLWAYARDLYAWRGVAETVDLTAIREGYYLNDGDHNPHRIVADAPEADWDEPHGREILGPARLMLRTGKPIAIDPRTLCRLDR